MARPLVRVKAICHPTPEKRGYLGQRIAQGEERKYALEYVGKPIYVNHVTKGKRPIGAVTKIEEGPHGQLVACFYIDPNTPEGDDVVRKIKAQYYRCVSMGFEFQCLKDQSVFWDPMPLELSVCGQGMLEGTRILALLDLEEYVKYGFEYGLKSLLEGPPDFEKVLKRKDVHSQLLVPPNYQRRLALLKRLYDIDKDTSPKLDKVLKMSATTTAADTTTPAAEQTTGETVPVEKYQVLLEELRQKNAALARYSMKEEQELEMVKKEYEEMGGTVSKKLGTVFKSVNASIDPHFAIDYGVDPKQALAVIDMFSGDVQGMKTVEEIKGFYLKNGMPAMRMLCNAADNMAAAMKEIESAKAQAKNAEDKAAALTVQVAELQAKLSLPTDHISQVKASADVKGTALGSKAERYASESVASDDFEKQFESMRSGGAYKPITPEAREKLFSGPKRTKLGE
jgi:hypothetical protein